MSNFGEIKLKLLSSLTESYLLDKKTDIKNTINTMTKNKDFSELYLFYEDIENKYIEDINLCKMFVEQAETILMKKSKLVSDFLNYGFSKTMNTLTESSSIGDNEIYRSLDIISEENSLSNIDKKIKAKQFLINHINTKKIDESVSDVFVENQSLLNVVLVNNFNSKFVGTLSEEQVTIFKDIISMDNATLESEIKILKEELSEQLINLVNESDNEELKIKLLSVQKEVEDSTNSKVNFYKLKKLKKDLI